MTDGEGWPNDRLSDQRSGSFLSYYFIFAMERTDASPRSLRWRIGGSRARRKSHGGASKPLWWLVAPCFPVLENVSDLSRFVFHCFVFITLWVLWLHLLRVGIYLKLLRNWSFFREYFLTSERGVEIKKINLGISFSVSILKIFSFSNTLNLIHV